MGRVGDDLKVIWEISVKKLSFEDAIAAYAHDAQLKKHCQAKFKEAQAKIEKIVLGPGGGVGAEPQDMD